MARAASRPAEDEHHEAKGDDRRFGGPGCPMRRRIGQALQFHQQGDYPRAIGIYREYLDRDPDNARVLQILGLALRCDGDLDDAIVALSRSIAIDPNDAPTHCHLGNAYYEKSLLEDALSSFANAIDADPRSAEAFNDQGNVLRDLGRTEEAIASYRRTISIDATLAAPHFNLGNILWDSDRIDAAIESYRAAIEIDPGYAAAHNNLGNAYRAQSDLARAVRSYAEAVSCDGSFVLAHFNLANALNDLGRHDEALTAFRELLRYDPDNALARHMTAALTGEPATAAPHAFVRQVFDTYAGRFDTHLGATLDYRAPTALRDAVLARRTGSPPRDGPVFGRALDLGCGTGFVAEAFGAAVARFDGVDLSPRMLVEARRKNLYATLTEGELVAHMEERAAASSGYDAIVAADAFIYIGDLAPAFAAAAGCLAAGGVFAFSAELAETGTFELRRTGRFAQSEAYVRGLADGHGFVVEAVAPTVIRIEKGQPVNGAVFVLVNTPSPS
jgi:predicted TPR repeat methyltransferase